MQQEGQVKSRTKLPWNLTSRLLSNQKKRSAKRKREGKKKTYRGIRAFLWGERQCEKEVCKRNQDILGSLSHSFPSPHLIKLGCVFCPTFQENSLNPCNKFLYLLNEFLFLIST